VCERFTGFTVVVSEGNQASLIGSKTLIFAKLWAIIPLLLFDLVDRIVGAGGRGGCSRGGAVLGSRVRGSDGRGSGLGGGGATR